MIKFEFEDDFFKDEIRSDFYVPAIMKRVWAGQLKVLEDFDKVCEKYGLKWYAFVGTLLGAVRHKGFIPWDDDIDICMMREDYEKFMSIGNEMPFVFLRRESKESGGFHFDFEGLARVDSDDKVNIGGDRFEYYHKSPYIVGLDLYPMDYIPSSPDDKKLMFEIHNVIFATIEQYKYLNWNSKTEDLEESNVSEEDFEYCLQNVENITGVTVDRGGNIEHQLSNLLTAIDSMYTADESDMVACMYHMYAGYEYMLFPKEDFDKRLEVPFESGSIYIPKGYSDVLARNFGSGYMTPRQDITHNYPYYKPQEEVLLEYLKNHPEAKSLIKKEYFYHIYDENKEFLDSIYEEKE